MSQRLSSLRTLALAIGLVLAFLLSSAFVGCNDPPGTPVPAQPTASAADPGFLNTVISIAQTAVPATDGACHVQNCH